MNNILGPRISFSDFQVTSLKFRTVKEDSRFGTCPKRRDRHIRRLQFSNAVCSLPHKTSHSFISFFFFVSYVTILLCLQIKTSFFKSRADVTSWSWHVPLRSHVRNGTERLQVNLFRELEHRCPPSFLYNLSPQRVWAYRLQKEDFITFSYSQVPSALLYC